MALRARKRLLMKERGAGLEAMLGTCIGREELVDVCDESNHNNGEHPLRLSSVNKVNGGENTKPWSNGSIKMETEIDVSSNSLRVSRDNGSTEAENNKIALEQNGSATDVISVSNVSVGDDPLGMMTSAPGSDPLSPASNFSPPASSRVSSPINTKEMNLSSSSDGDIIKLSSSKDKLYFSDGSVNYNKVDFEWTNVVKDKWLREAHTKAGVIKVTTDFKVLSREGKELRTLSSRLQHIENLNDAKSSSEDVGLSQSDYVAKLRELNEEIATSWVENNRVGALKLAIRVASLLMDTNVPSFYNTLFVLVSELMDTMGQLVWDRIRQKVRIADLFKHQRHS